MIAPLCPYCGSTAVLRDSRMIYKRSYGPIWICPKYPECDSYCGCHKGTKQPLGRLANRELREAKKAAHAVFDRLWKSGEMTRKSAYRWLARKLGMRHYDCHIGEFDLALCQRVVELCKARAA